MIRLLLALLLAALSTPFEAHFQDKTMRVDLLHTGGHGVEILAVDRIVSDGPWPGSRTKLLDDTNLGTYLFEVVDPRTNSVLFSRGYSSLYAEWETTSEPKERHRTLRESLRFPWPKAPVQVVVKRRDTRNHFKEVFTAAIDPAGKEVNPADLRAAGQVVPLFENGPASDKVDLLVLGEGYSEKELPKLRRDAERMMAALFAREPFKSRKRDFNVRLLLAPTAESGALRPQNGVFRRTPLSVQYGIFGSERYVLTYDDRALRDVASAAPYDYLEILVNDARYGGGGIYAYQATASVDTAFAEYVFVHEFGHHFAGLGDEYYTSDVAYETGAAERPEPWEPNITALHDPKNVKWSELVTAGTPLPTPWDKEVFETESRKVQAERRKLLADGAQPSALDELFSREKVAETKFLSSMTWSGKVGAFEGAGYEAKGLYRPAADCIMFTRDDVGFCPVCRRAIERVIDLYSSPPSPSSSSLVKK